MPSTLAYTGKLAVETCCVCSIRFAMPDDLAARARESSRVSFYCPAGHCQHYTTDTVHSLRNQVRAAEAALVAAQDQARAAEYRRRAAVGQLTKTRRRIANGVCPCCNRTFQNLAGHMASKHPGYEQQQPA